jgi:toxin YoeB
MAKEIRWSIRADRDRIDIFDYWTKRNQSAAYSKKLNKLFNLKTEYAAKFPNSGKLTKHPFVRTKVASHYLIYYRITAEYIEIVTIWDCRRNPKKLKL